MAETLSFEEMVLKVYILQQHRPPLVFIGRSYTFLSRTVQAEDGYTASTVQNKEQEEQSGSGQRKLSIIPIDSEGYSGRQLRMASNNGKNVLFLVPLQGELETAPLPFSSPEFSKMPKVACNNCLEIIPLQMLALHSESCQTAVKGTMVLKVSLGRSFNIEEDMDPNLPGSSSSNSTLPLPGPSTQTTEVWKTAAPSEAVRLFMEDLRRGGDHQPPLRLTLNAGDTDEEWDGTLISFYKQRRETCQWAADFRCSILGNAGVTAIFEGQREHLVPNLCTAILESDLFAMAGRMVGHSSIHGGPSLSGLSPAVLDALTHGAKDIVTSKLCLEDCPEIEVRDTISLLLKEEWTEAESVRVADLCTQWYFPVPTKETNRLLLFQQLLSHAVLGRAKAQIKQFRKGIKETGIWPLLTARPDVLPLLFPHETDIELTPQMVLKCIIWPEASIDSDDSVDEMSTTNINLISGFFRAFVKEASSDVLKGLMKFWTGWELPSPRLTFKVVRSRGHHHLPTASTCYERLRIPDHYKSGSALKLDLHACIESVQSGFGLI
ncbi:G2/M phase-specific E3 ubiquitin-protein ligase [Collichthys lucidus]|uniref:G2/M phase-specific E3 ubiquitin-protein ligase n=1 Tax=Collichthys lucidus TaxID=240159 RepID=A0A4U5UH50_COLLU|nr:G2/M phase-specific E3 ubiquitin-protein ligase [Collichthys lucidus]